MMCVHAWAALRGLWEALAGKRGWPFDVYMRSILLTAFLIDPFDFERCFSVR